MFCPYCKAVHSKDVAIGTTGLVSTGRLEVGIKCKECDEIFVCEVDVTVSFKTKKSV